MRNSFYIQHDYSARNDQKILRLRYKFGWEGYGLFWAICETMAEDSTGYINRGAIGGLSVGYGVAIEKLQEIFDYCVEIALFHLCEHKNYFNQRILDHKAERVFFSEKGIEGNEKRWGKRRANRIENKKDTVIAEEDRIGEERIGKKSKNRNQEFIPPSEEESLNFCKENGFENIADKIYKYYSEANPPWSDSKGNPVRSWKSKYRAVWFRDENKKSSPQQKKPSFDAEKYFSEMGEQK